jgi:polyhydroxyalkanoate synthesis regulator phasin
MEGYSMNLDNKEIADALVERFEIEAERGDAVVNEGMNTVKEAGII